MYFINENTSDIQIVLNTITPKRLKRALRDKGFPFPSDVNKYCIISVNNKVNLCYSYGSKPTIILVLLAMELPVNNWRLYVEK